MELAAQEAAPQELDFEAIHQELYTQPQNAQVDPETYQATDHVVGVDFDPVQAQPCMMRRERGRPSPSR